MERYEGSGASQMGLRLEGVSLNDAGILFWGDFSFIQKAFFPFGLENIKRAAQASGDLGHIYNNVNIPFYPNIYIFKLYWKLLY